eukprot:133843_1
MGLQFKNKSKKKINIQAYLENIVGDYVNQHMLETITQKLKKQKYSESNAREIGELIYMFPVDAINEKFGFEKDNNNDEKDVENNKLVDSLKDITRMDEDYLVQINNVLMRYNVKKTNDE